MSNISDISKAHIKVNDLARWAWCQEEAYWRVHGVVRPETVVDVAGQQTHAKLREQLGPLNQELFHQLRVFYPLVRRLAGVGIYGYVDGFDEGGLGRGEVSLIEYKSTSADKPYAPGLPVAVLQLQLYAWLLEPYVVKLGYSMSHTHAIEIVRKESGALLERTPIVVDPGAVETELKERLVHLKSGEGLQGAKLEQPWKCEKCPAVFKSKCRFWNQSSSSEASLKKRDSANNAAST